MVPKRMFLTEQGLQSSCMRRGTKPSWMWPGCVRPCRRSSVVPPHAQLAQVVGDFHTIPSLQLPALTVLARTALPAALALLVLGIYAGAWRRDLRFRSLANTRRARVNARRRGQTVAVVAFFSSVCPGRLALWCASLVLSSVSDSAFSRRRTLESDCAAPLSGWPVSVQLCNFCPLFTQFFKKNISRWQRM